MKNFKLNIVDLEVSTDEYVKQLSVIQEYVQTMHVDVELDQDIETEVISREIGEYEEVYIELKAKRDLIEIINEIDEIITVLSKEVNGLEIEASFKPEIIDAKNNRVKFRVEWIESFNMCRY